MLDFRLTGQLNSSQTGNTPTIQAICPGCAAKANFIPLPGSGGDIQDIMELRPNLATYYGMRRCPDKNCNTLVWFRLQRAGNEEPTLFIYPPPAAVFNINDVPAEIEADAKEALLAYTVTAYKATVVMCRRTIEAACEQQGASGRNLKAQIDDLHAKGLISAGLKDLSHQIRFFGNSGAHHDPTFGSIQQGDAELMIEFMTTFLRYVYEMPAKIAEAQARTGKR